MTALRTAELRRRVVAEAHTWARTPYHHHGRIKGVGVDCAQILAAVFEAAGIVRRLDLGNYAPQWHLHQGEEVYLRWLHVVGATRLAPGLHPQAGDIGVWRFGRTFSHGAIVLEGGADPLLLHAYIGRGVIFTRASDDPLAGRDHCYWSAI